MFIRSFSDEEIVESLKNGTEKERNAVIKFVYKKNSGAIENYVLKNGGTKEDADDLFQESLTTTYLKVIDGSFKAKSSIHTFLFAVCKNSWLNRLRKKTNSVSIEMISNERSRDETTDESVGGLNVFHQVYQLLSEECQKILKLAYYENLSMKEIAARFISLQNEQSARTKKYRCMKNLSQLMDKKGLKRQHFNL